MIPATIKSPPFTFPIPKSQSDPQNSKEIPIRSLNSSGPDHSKGRNHTFHSDLGESPHKIKKITENIFPSVSSSSLTHSNDRPSTPPATITVSYGISSTASHKTPQSCRSVQDQMRLKTIEKLAEKRRDQIYYLNGNEIQFIPLEIDGDQAKGAHSCIFSIAPSDLSYYPEVANENIIAKMPRIVEKLDRFYDFAFIQHDRLLKEENVPFKIARILNRETCCQDGFLLQEKVIPFKKAPWGENESLESIQTDPIKNAYLEQIIEMFIYTLSDTNNPGLDLRWTNLGIPLTSSSNAPNIILFDFYEEDTPFQALAKDSLLLISGKNQEVQNYIVSKLPSFSGNVYLENCIKSFSEK